MHHSAAIRGVLDAVVAQPALQGGDAIPLADIERLLDRLTYGATESERALAHSIGYDTYLEYQLDYWAIDDSEIEARVALEYPTLAMSASQLAADMAAGVDAHLIEATTLRSIFSPRQLYQRVCEMWTDHFNIVMASQPGIWLKAVNDREVIRPYAMGSFPDLLREMTRSPAMLQFLDNDANLVGVPNENLARELMELHTLGVDGGYTQADVEDVARCFTGWSYYPPEYGGLAYQFRFNASHHDNGEKWVLGNLIPANGGVLDGEIVLQILGAHPSTARHIATRMLRWFIGYEPRASLVDGLAAEYQATNGHIPSMIRWMMQRRCLAMSTPKFKRPFHLIVSALRAVNASVVGLYDLRNSAMRPCGHTPFKWFPPDGYPDDLTYWSGLLLPRWNVGASLMNNNYGGVTFDLSALKAGAVTSDAVMDRIDQLLFGGRMPAADRAAVRAYLPPLLPPTDGNIAEAFGLALGSPGFQWY